MKNCAFLYTALLHHRLFAHQPFSQNTPAPTLAAYDSLWKEEAFTLVSDRHRQSATPLDHATIEALIHEGPCSYAEAYNALAPGEMTLNL